MTTPDARFTPNDLAIEQQLAWLSGNIRFLLEVTPVNANEARDRYLAGDVDEPEFEYRDLTIDLDVANCALANVPVDAVSNPTLRALLERKVREMRLQLQMLAARGTDEFRELSVQLFGPVRDDLLATAQDLLERIEVPARNAGKLTSSQFLDLAQAEIRRYKRIDPDIELFAEIRSDVSGVLCEAEALIVAEDAVIFEDRAEALLQHEVGTHLVTQVNGTHQHISTMGAGLAGYEETQEGLAVVAEIAVGGLTAFRLRQLAARVVTVDSMLGGAPFSATHRLLVDAGLPPRTAFSTVMRVYRAGGFTKDAIYLRGLLALLRHVRDGGSLDLFYLGKFALDDLELIEDLHRRGLLRPARIMPPYLDEEGLGRILRAAHTDDLLALLPTPARKDTP